MSDIFDLDTGGQRAMAGVAQDNLLQPGQDHPGFWHGVPQSIGMGVMRGGVRAAQAVGMAGGGLLSLLEQDHEGGEGLKPGTLTDPYFSGLDKYVSSAIDYWTPGANEVGTAGRVLGGFSEMALPLMAGGGNPSLLIGSAAMGSGHDLVQQGVDAKTATGVAITQAAATAAGFRIPFLGNTLVSRIASGAAGNLAVNAGSAEISHAILQAAGYDEQAKQFDPLDLEARIIDVLSGVAFGGLAHLATPTMRDAAATASNAKHFQSDTAPGEPADITASVAHQKAMEAAMRDTLAGDPVDLSGTGVEKAEFTPRDRQIEPFTETPEELQGVDEAIKEQPAQNPDRVDPTEEAPGTATEFSTAKGSTYRVTDSGTTIRDKAARPEHPEQGERGIQPESEQTFYVTAEDALKLAEFQTQGAKKAIELRGDQAAVKYLDGASAGKFEKRTLVKVQDKPAVGLTPVELWKNGTMVHFGNAITEVREAKSAARTTSPSEIESHKATPSERSVVDPVVSSARAAVAKDDFPIPTGEIDQDGRVITRSAREMLDQADQDVAKAQNDSKAFDALASCILSRGNG